MNARSAAATPEKPRRLAGLFKRYEICLVRPTGVKPLCAVGGWMWLIPMGLLLALAAAAGFLWQYRADYAALSQRLADTQAQIAKGRDALFDQARRASRVQGELGRMALFNAKLAALSGLEEKPAAPGAQRQTERAAPAERAPAPLRLDALALYRPQILARRLSPYLSALNREILNLEVRQQELILGLRDRRIFLAATPSIWPIDGEFSSGFGWRHGGFHKGVDLTAPTGTPVMASADGKVTFVGYDGGYGLKIIIEHKFGMTTAYAHLKKAEVAEGQMVSRGQLIAQSGASGRTTGAHLHYEVMRGQTLVDPLNYMLD